MSINNWRCLGKSLHVSQITFVSWHAWMETSSVDMVPYNILDSLAKFWMDLLGFFLIFSLMDLTSLGVLSVQGWPCSSLFWMSPISSKHLKILHTSILFTFRLLQISFAVNRSTIAVHLSKILLIVIFWCLKV